MTESQTKQDLHAAKEERAKTKDGKHFFSFAEVFAKEVPGFVQDEVAVKKEEQCYLSLTEDPTKEDLHAAKEERAKTKDGK